MIGRLVGKVVEDGADGTAILDVRGVGYQVTAPLGTLGRAAPDESGSITLWIHTHVREDALLLYAFATREDRAVFELLISVSSIGPKIALSILGSMSVHDLAGIIAAGETSKLTRVPGVGKKTAERIVLELKDKLLAAPPAATATTPVRPAPRGAKGELLHGALTRMGYRPAEADRAVAALGSRVESEPLADLVREALAVLAP